MKCFTPPLRKSTALSAVSHKMNSPLGLHSGQWCVDLQCLMYETISSLYLEERTLSLEEGSWVLFLFQWCWERQGHRIPRCAGKEGLCLRCRLQTHRTPSSRAGQELMPLLRPSPHFLLNVHTVALRFGNEMESRPHKSQTYRKLHVMKQRRLKEIKLCLFSSIY